MPTARATLAAVRRSSPVSITASRPISRSAATASPAGRLDGIRDGDDAGEPPVHRHVDRRVPIRGDTRPRPPPVAPGRWRARATARYCPRLPDDPRPCRGRRGLCGSRNRPPEQSARRAGATRPRLLRPADARSAPRPPRRAPPAAPRPGRQPRSTPGTSTTVCTAGCPSVIVPVLSNTTVSIAWLRSSASPPLMSTPSSAPRPVETITAVGTASPMAHGQAMISTVTADTSACRYAGAGPTSNQTTKVTMAIDSTTGTNTAETRSASRWIGALLPCACWTRRMIRDSTVSPPTRSTRTRSAPFWLSVAPMTVSPGRLVIGVGSPVSIDSSTLLAPSTTTPSAGIVSPGRTRTSSPVRSAVSGMSSSWPARRTRAAAGLSPISRRMAPDVCPLARASSRLPSSTSAMIQATVS